MILLLLTALLIWSPVASRQCGFQTAEQNGTIISPERSGYGARVSCIWNITAPEGSIIRLQITSFSLPGSLGSCSSAWLIIKGTTSKLNDKVNKRLCGSQIYNGIIRLGNKVNIEYFSDGYTSSHFTLVYNAVLVTAADMTAAWIANNTKTLLAAKDRLSFAVPALYLFDETLLKEEKETGYKFRTQYLLRLSEDLLRNSTQHLSLADLSHHVTALLSICSNPRSFHGINLVRHLRQLADTRPNIPKPFDILALCNAQEKITLSDIEILGNILLKEDPSIILLDFKAIAVMALICVKRQVEEFPELYEENVTTRGKAALDGFLQISVDAIKLRQKRDGGFGSLQTTALVYQALSAAGAYGWDIKSAFKFISQHNHTDGSFGNLDDLYAVLPTLKDKTLLNISASNCDFSEDGATPLQEVKDKLTTFISVTYQLWIGDEVDVKHTITVRFPNGTNFADMMRLAAEKDEKYRLKWTFENGVIYVYEISNIINNPTSGKYWFLYTLTQDQQTVWYKEGLETYVPSDGDNAIMWYRTVDMAA